MSVKRKAARPTATARTLGAVKKTGARITGKRGAAAKPGSKAPCATDSPARRARDAELLRRFALAYPDPRSELDFKNPYELVVAVTLSAQCTDKKVNQVTPALFAYAPNFNALAEAQIETIESIIRPVNYYRTKSRNIVAMAQRVRAEFSGELPSDHDGMTSLPGVGRKTANVVLGELGICPTIPVDTHVMRVSGRLALSSGSDPVTVERELAARFPPEIWRNLHHWLIYHGRRVCKAQRPLCEECVLRDLCPSARRDG